MDSIVFKKKSYSIEKVIKEENDCSIFLVSDEADKFLIKKFSSYSDMIGELELKKRLKRYGINVPKILKKDKKSSSYIEEFINDKTVLDELEAGELSEDYYKEIYSIYRFCRFSKINIDFMPENFVFGNKKMYYTSVKYGPFDPKNAFELEGVFYWIYSSQCVEHLEMLNRKVDKKRKLIVPEANKKVALLTVLYW